LDHQLIVANIIHVSIEFQHNVSASLSGHRTFSVVQLLCNFLQKSRHCLLFLTRAGEEKPGFQHIQASFEPHFSHQCANWHEVPEPEPEAKKRFGFNFGRFSKK